MSIMRRPVYRQNGGITTDFYEEDITYGAQPHVAQPTGPNLVGAGNAANAGGTNTGITSADNLNSAFDKTADFYADPNTAPQYYSESTVADFNPTQLQAQQRQVDVAGQTDTLTNQRLSEYQSQLDPNSQLNQLARQQGAQDAAGAYFGAGTPGSARGQYASALASQDAYGRNRAAALQGIAGAQGDLSGGADILNQVGNTRQGLTQDYINEDIKKWNFAELAPENQLNKQLAVRTQQEALKNNAAGGGAAGESQSWQDKLKGNLVDWGVDKATDWFSDLIFNEGGSVQYHNQGGGIMGGVPQTSMGMGPQPQGMQQQMPPQPMQPPMPQQMPQQMMEVEEKSEIDMIEDKLTAMAEASGGDIVVTRKETKRRAK